MDIFLSIALLVVCAASIMAPQTALRRSLGVAMEALRTQRKAIDNQASLLEEQSALIERLLEDVKQSNTLAERALDERDSVIRRSLIAN